MSPKKVSLIRTLHTTLADVRSLLAGSLETPISFSCCDEPAAIGESLNVTADPKVGVDPAEYVDISAVPPTSV